MSSRCQTGTSGQEEVWRDEQKETPTAWTSIHQLLGAQMDMSIFKASSVLLAIDNLASLQGCSTVAVDMSLPLPGCGFAVGADP